jgi:hypothetical protein
MAEAITFIVCAFIIGPAIFVFADEWKQLKQERDEYRALLDEYEIEASMRRHPAAQSYMTLRRIK